MGGCGYSGVALFVMAGLEAVDDAGMRHDGTDRDGWRAGLETSDRTETHKPKASYVKKPASRESARGRVQVREEWRF